MAGGPPRIESPVTESMNQAQLLIFARDLKQALRQERRKSIELAGALEQLTTLNQRLEEALDRERRSRQETEQAHRESTLRLLLASRYKDEETGAHLERVGLYSLAVGRHIGLSERQAQLIAAAAPMHDVGKIALRDAILLKPGPARS